MKFFAYIVAVAASALLLLGPGAIVVAQSSTSPAPGSTATPAASSTKIKLFGPIHTFLLPQLCHRCSSGFILVALILTKQKDLFARFRDKMLCTI